MQKFLENVSENFKKLKLFEKTIVVLIPVLILWAIVRLPIQNGLGFWIFWPLVLIGAFQVLIWASDWMILAAKEIALKAGWSLLVVGMVIVSAGTTLPELTVNMIASFDNNVGVALGNIFGSNTFNGLFILGLVMIISGRVYVSRKAVFKRMPLAIIAMALGCVFCLFDFFLWKTDNHLVWYEGIILLIGFYFYERYLVRTAKKTADEASLRTDDPAMIEYLEMEKERATHAKEPKFRFEGNFIQRIKQLVKRIRFFFVDNKRPIGFFAIGIVGLSFGSKFLIDSTRSMATMVGLSDEIVGLIVGIGTSMPEFMVGVRSAMGGTTDLTVGNIIGANTINIVWILALSSIVRPLPLSPSALVDMWSALGTILILFLFVLMYRKKTGDSIQYVWQRWQGIVLVLAYCAYGYVRYLIDVGRIILQ